MQGGDGRDLADYGLRAVDLVLSMGDGANDGAAGEGDEIATDIERLRGGSGNDLLTGDNRGNYLDGMGGDDELTGRRGNDLMLGGSGNDHLDAADPPQFTDRLLCGSGTDITPPMPPISSTWTASERRRSRSRHERRRLSVRRGTPTLASSEASRPTSEEWLAAVLATVKSRPWRVGTSA